MRKKSLHVNSKLNKSQEIKFIIAFSKNPDPPLGKLTTPFATSPPSKKKFKPPPALLSKIVKIHFPL